MKFHVKRERRIPVGGHGKGNSRREVEDGWRTCCQSMDAHRFDCGDTPREKRGDGPFLVMRARSS